MGGRWLTLALNGWRYLLPSYFCVFLPVCLCHQAASYWNNNERQAGIQARLIYPHLELKIIPPTALAAEQVLERPVYLQVVVPRLKRSPMNHDANIKWWREIKYAIGGLQDHEDINHETARAFARSIKKRRLRITDYWWAIIQNNMKRNTNRAGQ